MERPRMRDPGTEKQTLALEVRSISKTFGLSRVLCGVDLSVRPREIHALVGENGSGKSTLVKVLAGYHVPDAGAVIRVGGREIVPRHRGASEEAGLRFVHQDLALVGALSTVENLGLGRGYGRRALGPVRWRDRRREAEEAMRGLGYDVDVEQPVSTLLASERTAVAIARALSPRAEPARFLVLDEPTATLPGVEIDRLFDLLRRVREAGLGILFISHHLKEIFELADQVTVLRNGFVVGTRRVEDVTEESVIEMMVGRAVRPPQAASKIRLARPTLRAEGVAGGPVRHFNLEVAAGEIVGVAGITGSGREAVAAMLFGAQECKGTITVGDSVLKVGRPDLSIAAGVGLVPAERARSAVLHNHSVGENLSIVRPTDFVHGFWYSRRREAAEVAKWLEKMDVRPRQSELPFDLLSGGNAQRVILARWLRLEPRVLLLDEPTQGVDVGAKEEIHRRVELAASRGCAVLICSTDSEELARLCSRIVVMVRGQVAQELSAPLSGDEITSACLHTAGGR